MLDLLIAGTIESTQIDLLKTDIDPGINRVADTVDADMGTFPIRLVQPPTVTVQEPIKGQIIKPTFKDKHPKIYRQFRKVRAVCVALAPIVNCAGSTAQIANYFRR